MRQPVFDLDALRSFVMGVELGNFAQAAERLHRSTSAVSAHLKKLEHQLQQPLLIKQGRHLQLLPAGEQLLSHARQLLALNDETWLSMQQGPLTGKIRLGLQEDFGESLLTSTLGQFYRAHPNVQIEVQVARQAQLKHAIQADQLDLALVWHDGFTEGRHYRIVHRTPMCWIGARDEHSIPSVQTHTPLPLVLFDAPCLMRQQALDALDQAGIPWTINMTSHSLSGIWSAVAAGLGITLRTPFGLPANLQVLSNTPSLNRLPALPELQVGLLHSTHTPSPALTHLEQMLIQDLLTGTPPAQTSTEGL